MMRIMVLFLCAFSALVSCNPDSKIKDQAVSEMIWYEEPASVWTQALPAGNGRIAAMVYGRTDQEIIQFNEETLWTGQPHDYAREGSHMYLDLMRKLLWEGKQKEAEDLAMDEFMSIPVGQMSYQPFGDLVLTFPRESEPVNYRRELDLTTAINAITYQSDGVNFRREVFASHPDQALIIRLEADKKGAINFTAGLNSAHQEREVKIDQNVLVAKGKADNYSGRRANPEYPDSKLRYEARLKIVNEGGELIPETSSLRVSGANIVTMYLVAATSFVNYQDITGNPEKKCREFLSGLDGKSYRRIKADHIQDYQSLYDRVKFDLEGSEISNRPTDQRLKTFLDDEDPTLVALLYQFGRYLLISSSRPGTQPANLQGIWNDQLSPPWDSKYTININTEMNYWPAEITNLPELTEPLISMLEDLAVTGQNTAREHYNLDGWVTHHNTDLWRGAAPINHSNHGIWPTGGAWLCQHLWWHYEFSGDLDYLSDRAYPVMKEASRFFADYLVSDPANPEWLVSGPSNSPEIGGLVMAPTMDHQIIRNLFDNTIEAAEILDRDAEFIEFLKEKRSRIAPNQIGQYGQLKEWLKDIDDPDNTHRHVSHLWGLHPGNEIHPTITPELAEACKVTLSHRGDEGTGWSRAWKINFWARLLDGDHSYLLLKNMMVPAGSETTGSSRRGGLYDNLFDAHPPFQIDGNFGVTSGITEMLLQSHLRNEDGDYIIDILPALPSKLSSGSISGIKGRGGFEFSITWANGELKNVSVKSLLGRKLLLRYSGKLIEQETNQDEVYTYEASYFSE